MTNCYLIRQENFTIADNSLSLNSGIFVFIMNKLISLNIFYQFKKYVFFYRMLSCDNYWFYITWQYFVKSIPIVVYLFNVIIRKQVYRLIC